MSFLKWHKKQVEKNLNMFGLSNYQGLWVSFIKGLIFGAIIMWFVSCNEQVVVKKAPTTETKTTSELQSDYSIGVKGNCGMCKSTIEKSVKGLDFVKNAEWGIKSKILDVIYGKSQLKELDSLRNIRATTQNGFRIQLYESSSPEKINGLVKKYKEKMTDSLYVIFEAPVYKIHYGNFSKKYEAEKIKNQLKQKGFKNIWIVRSRIEQKLLYDSRK